MPSFTYKAVDDTGRVVKGTTSAHSENDVEQELASAGLTLIHSKTNPQGSLSGFRIGNGVKPRTLVEFYYRFSQALEIGLPILNALEENADYLPSREMRRIIGEIKVGVERGRSLHASMADYPKVFNKLDLAIIRMGEQSGVMPQCLKRMAQFHEWKDELRAQIKKATIYPAFIITAILAVAAVWIGYVLPQMVEVLSEMGVALPQATMLVLSFSEKVKADWFWILTGGGMLAAAFYFFQKTKHGALLFHQYLLKIPLLGRILYNIVLARLSHNFSIMFNAGMAIQQIFTTLCDHALGNRFMERRLYQAYREIEAGSSIAAAFETVGGFPPLLVGAIRNGEETGTLEEAFERMGNNFDTDVKRTVQVLVSSIEPMATISLGVIFGLIVLSILLPLYDVVGTMGKAY